MFRSQGDFYERLREKASATQLFKTNVWHWASRLKILRVKSYK